MQTYSYTRRILHLDGHWRTHERVRELVERACPDCEIVTTENGDEALKTIETGPVDLVIVDPWASEETGINVCEYLAANKPDVPVFFYYRRKNMNDRKLVEAGDGWAFFREDEHDKLVGAIADVLGTGDMGPRVS